MTIFAVTGMLLEIFFWRFSWIADVDGEEDEAFAGELMADLSTKAASSAQKPHQVVRIREGRLCLLMVSW